MKKFLQKKLNQKGLTLVELLAVIVILGIIAAIAVPAIGNIIENTKYNAVKSDALNAISAANLFFAEEPTASEITVSKLVSDGYLDEKGKLGDNVTVKKGTDNKVVINGETGAYTGTKTVTFTNANVKGINEDNQKGSGVIKPIVAK